MESWMRSSPQGGNERTRMAKNDDKTIRCTFCGKQQDEVHRLIAGPGVYICNECVELCHEIIEEDAESAPLDLTEVPKPQEILD